MIKIMAATVILFLVIDGLSEYLTVHHGWMWLRHGGALGEYQKLDREAFLAKKEG